MTDLFEDLAAQLAEQPGPAAETTELIRRRLIAAMRENEIVRPRSAVSARARVRVSVVPDPLDRPPARCAWRSL